jgi:hypothetical protein
VCQHQQCSAGERSQQMLATSVHGSHDRVLGMCSVPKPPCTLCAGLCWSALLEQPCGLWSKLGSSHKQVSTSLQQLAVALRGEYSMTLHPHRACAVCLDTLVLLYHCLHTQCAVLREPCTHATARTSLQQQRVCSRRVESQA